MAASGTILAPVGDLTTAFGSGTSVDDSPISARHPDYTAMTTKWEKWRLTYDGGFEFIKKYMCKLSARETTLDFNDRKSIAYTPNFGKAAINDIKNAIFQRTVDVTRLGGSKSYQQAIKGQDLGVDLQGSSMATFVGAELLKELLVMQKIGVLVDMPRDLGTTQLDKGSKRPYLDTYFAEDILSWAPRKPIEGFSHLLLKEKIDTTDKFGLPDGSDLRYRLMVRNDKGVSVTFYNQEGQIIKTLQLEVEKIPFTVFEVPTSLMMDVADYQIALLNIESSDIAFVRKANFPFYYEFFDPKAEGAYQKGPGAPGDTGIAADQISKNKEVAVGVTQGRRFPRGIEAPGFINPDAETLRVSMEKGKQLKEDIRLLVNLNLVSMNPRRQASDSKEMDYRSLEASLSYIGLILAKGEQEIANHWEMFERNTKPAQIAYPRTYSLKSEGDRRIEGKELEELSDKIPSKTFRKATKYKIARLIMGGDLTDEELITIKKEIDDAPVDTADTGVILSAHKSGLVDDISASTSLGFDGEKVIPQAKLDRAERIKLSMEAQGGETGEARGTPEFEKGKQDSVEEKAKKQKRGQQDDTDKGSEQK